ncbi:MAG: tRNA (guanosine(37)-N1)-methyltransferase TrmD [Verrucomicrobiae bacterium]|nr:tRNA (guanosine(37)-N1)-methyltransferase TrmD [Verrucomicrobiae bacterium]
MKIDIVTIFPEMCRAPLGESMMKRAQAAGQLELAVHDLRDWTTDRHRQVDDIPYGGGPGMVMKPEPFFAAVRDLKRDSPNAKVILLTPQGRRFDQVCARELATESHLIFLCGHYEGVDHRVVEALVDLELSIGDYVLTNGAIAAVVVVDAVVRLLPGVLGDSRSPEEESFGDPKATGHPPLLEAPHYTRPAEFEGMAVPEVLQSGHHGNIAAWRHEQALARTRQNRPDLSPES